jgi:hypothetical protein
MPPFPSDFRVFYCVVSIRVRPLHFQATELKVDRLLQVEFTSDRLLQDGIALISHHPAYRVRAQAKIKIKEN